MATGLKRIEKEFILGSLRDEKIKLLLLAGSGKGASGEWPVYVTSFSAEAINLAHAMPERLLRRGAQYEFRFVYREQAMAFTSAILEVKEASLVARMPELIYKNLGRRYTRRAPPLDFAVSFSFMGDRYELSFPTTGEFDPVSEPEPSQTFDPGDIKSLIHEFNARADEYASDKAIVMFRERKPERPEEKVIVRTGKVFYLPTAMGGLPSMDPYVESRIVTRSIFADYVREQGVREELVEDEVVRFERNQKTQGILSELLVPVIFQEYVIGYVSLINRQVGKPPFDLAVLDLFYQFSKILAYSLKINGYFAAAPKKDSGFSADVIDVSAGGLLFANPSRELAGSLLPGSKIELAIRIGSRTVKASALLKRSYRDKELVYYAVEYAELAPEDFRFLFEALYGRPFTDADADCVEGLGIKLPCPKVF